MKETAQKIVFINLKAVEEIFNAIKHLISESQLVIISTSQIFTYFIAKLGRL